VSSRRTLILVSALAVGAIAALLIFQYVGGIEDKAQGDAQMVSVAIVKGAVTKGATADELIASGAIGVGERRQVELPTNVVKRPEEILGQIAQLDLAPGTVITSTMFQSDAALGNSVATAIREGMVLVTTSVDTIKGVAGLLNQGDFVNLTYTGDCVVGADGKLLITKGGETTVGTDAGAADPAAAATIPCAGSLYQKARIVALGRSLGTGVSTPVATPGAEAPPTTEAVSDQVTFEVPPEAAQVIQLAGPGSLYLTLVRKDYVPHSIPMTNFLPMQGVDGLTPYGVDPELQTAGE